MRVEKTIPETRKGPGQGLGEGVVHELEHHYRCLELVARAEGEHVGKLPAGKTLQLPLHHLPKRYVYTRVCMCVCILHLCMHACMHTYNIDDTCTT